MNPSAAPAPGSFPTVTVLWATLGVLLALAGIGVILVLRFGKDRAPIRLPGVGPISRVTLLVVGLALLGAGYHVFVYALGILREFRAPLAIAIGVAIVAILGSLGVDLMENRLDEPSESDQE